MDEKTKYNQYIQKINELLNDKNPKISIVKQTFAEFVEYINASKSLAEKSKKIDEDILLSNVAKKFVNEFLANINHEFRTPLNAILGFSDILKDKLSNNPEYLDYLDGITKGGQSLLLLLNDILDLAKIESGKLEILKTEGNLYTLFDDLKHNFFNACHEKDIELKFEISKTIPASMVFDYSRFRQIFYNIISNAVKFTHSGCITISATGEIQKTEISSNTNLFDLHVSVIDTGIGISEKQLNYIFEPFKQGEEPTTKKYGGTGLGLAITKKLLEILGGKIEIESKIKKGTIVNIFIPNILISSHNQMLLHDFESLAFDFKAATILVVDDVDFNRNIIKNFLQTYPFNLIEADSGANAIELLKLTKPDLILLDTQMPVTDGYKIIRQIKNFPEKFNLKKVPVIALTVYSKTELQKVKETFDDFIFKPISKKQLINTLAKFLPYKQNQKGISKHQEKIKHKISAEQKQILKNHELMKIIDEQLYPLYETACSSLSFSKIRDFAEAVKSTGEIFKNHELLDYGNALIHSAANFNVNDISKKLSAFYELIDKIDKSGK